MDITKNIAIDEHYTITSSSAIVGSIVTSRGDQKVIKVPTPSTPRTITITRFVRDTSIKVKTLDTNSLIEEMVSRTKTRNNKIIPLPTESIIYVKKPELVPEYSVPFNKILLSSGIKKLESARVMDVINEEKLLGKRLVAMNMDKDRDISRQNLLDLLGSQPKRKLGVQTAAVFRNVEQITTQRRIETQKKELRRDLKKAVLNNELLKKNVDGLNKQLSSSKKELKLLKSNLMNNYVTKSYHLKQLTRLQITLQKYAHMATGISAYQGEFVTGGEVGETIREKRKQQVAAMEQLQQTRKENKLGSLFNKMGMKNRR